MRSRKIIETSQDETREWILLLAAIYIVTMKILPIFIYQGELKDLRDSWIENIGNNTIYFIVISIG